MRTKLAKQENVRAEFSGTFERFGKKNGWEGRIEDTVLLKDIKNQQGEIMTDHAWFNYTKGFQALDLQEGDVVVFNARVKEYKAGYRGYDDEKRMENPPRVDYKFNRPTKVRLTKTDS